MAFLTEQEKIVDNGSEMTPHFLFGGPFAPKSSSKICCSGKNNRPLVKTFKFQQIHIYS